MACILVIKEDINKSIDEILGGYRDATHSYKEAQRRSKEINDRWSNLSRVEKFGDNRAKVELSDTVFEKVANEALASQEDLTDEIDTLFDTDIVEELTTGVKNPDEVFDENPEITTAEEEQVEEEHPIQTAYKNELAKTGDKPKVIITRNTKAILNDNGSYDLIDPSNNSVMQKNMNLDTMQIVETPISIKPYDEKIFDSFVRDTLLHPYTEIMLAERSIDINDVFDELNTIRTEDELSEVMAKILKSLC